MNMENMDLPNSTTENDSIDSTNTTTTLSASSTKKKTFPTDVFKWMKVNAKPKMALKLMQICKYFRHQEFPYFVVKNITAYDDTIHYTKLDGTTHEWDEIDDIPEKLWITNCISTDLLPQTYLISRLIPKIAVCDAKTLIFEDEEISMDDFKILTASGNVKELHLKRTLVADGIVSLEDILECVPAIEEIYLHKKLLLINGLFSVSYIPSFYSINVAKNLVLPNFKIFHLLLIPYDFDVPTFIEFMKNNKAVKFILRWHPSSYCGFIQLLQNFVEELAEIGDPEYPLPDITLPFQIEENFL